MLTNVETLIELQFQKIGKWALTNESLSIEFDTGKSVLLQTPNVLYSFVIYSNDDSSTIGYIGKTSKSIKNRFQGYLNPGVGQQTNIRVSKKITEAITSGHRVIIYALFDIEPLQWGGFSINLPAGLEDALVNKIKPKWNIAGVGAKHVITSTEELEEEKNVIQDSNSNDLVLVSFKIKLGEAYYNQGYMNPGVTASDYLGTHNEEVSLIIPNGRVLNSKIDRTANPNGSVRIYFGKELSDWYHQNYQIGDTLIAIVTQNNTIKFIDSY